MSTYTELVRRGWAIVQSECLCEPFPWGKAVVRDVENYAAICPSCGHRVATNAEIVLARQEIGDWPRIMTWTGTYHRGRSVMWFFNNLLRHVKRYRAIKGYD